MDWLRTARAHPLGDPSLDARVASRLGYELLLCSPDQQCDARALIEEGVVSARRLADPRVLGRVLTDLAASQFSADDTRAWIALNDEIRRCG